MTPDARPLPAAPPDLLVRAASWLQQALLGWVRTAAPPELIVADLVTGAAWARALAVIVHFGVADALQHGETAGALALRLNLDGDILYRAMRTLATRGIFRLGSDGCFHHTAASRALRRDHPSAMRDFVLYFTSPSNLAAWDHFDWTLTTGGSGFDHAHGMHVWQWFDRHPEERERFARAMAGMTRTQAPIVATLYPFREIASVCDIGGGTGLLLSEILVRHPHLTGVLCDAPAVLEAAGALIEARGLLDRMTIAPGSFFEQVPGDVDAYVLKNILHDWDDATGVRILEVIRTAARPGARLLMVETLVPRLSTDPIGTGSDLQMAVACSRGRERDAAELQALAREAGFSPGRVFPSTLIAVVESAVPTG